MEETRNEQRTLDWNAHSHSLIGAKPRHTLPEYVYEGRGISHWNGQRCEVVAREHEPKDTCTVVFACGCTGDVPRACVRPGSLCS